MVHQRKIARSRADVMLAKKQEISSGVRYSGTDLGLRFMRRPAATVHSSVQRSRGQLQAIPKVGAPPIVATGVSDAAMRRT